VRSSLDLARTTIFAQNDIGIAKFALAEPLLAAWNVSFAVTRKKLTGTDAFHPFSLSIA